MQVDSVLKKKWMGVCYEVLHNLKRPIVAKENIKSLVHMFCDYQALSNPEWSELKNVQCYYTIAIDKMFRNLRRYPDHINKKLGFYKIERETPASDDGTVSER